MIRLCCSKVIEAQAAAVQQLLQAWTVSGTSSCSPVVFEASVPVGTDGSCSVGTGVDWLIAFVKNR